MKKFLQTLMVVAVLCLPTLIHAQVSTYTFNTGVDASKWRALSASAWDTTLTSTSTTGDAFRSQLMNIGFSFNFGGTSYTQFSMNSDGCLRLGPVVTGTANYTTPFSTANASANNPKILGIGRDGRMRGPSSGYIDLGCYLACEVQGTAPNRVLVAEFNVAAYTSTTNCVTKWQVQLHEGSNVITIIYDSVPTETTATGYQIGMCTDANDVLIVDGATHTATAGASTTLNTGSTWPGLHRYYEFTPPTCPTPRPSVATLSSDEATIAWETAASSYNVEYGAQGFTRGQGTSATVTDTFYTIFNLNADSPYDFYIQSDCGSGDQGSWLKTTFRTACAPIATDSLPYTYDFEDATGTTASSEINSCWYRGTTYTTAYPYPSATTPHSGTKSMYFYATSTACSWLCLPQFESDLQTLQLKFWARRSSTSYTGKIKVGVMSNPSDLSTFVPVATVYANDGTNWTEFDALFTSYTGTGKYITILDDVPAAGEYSTNYIYIDDVTVEPMPACPHPVDVIAFDIDSVSATVAWTESGEASNWVVEYATSDFVPGTNAPYVETIQATDTAVFLTDLNPGTAYYVYVRSDCGNGDTSTFIGGIFYTACATVTTFPWTCNFDDVQGTTATTGANNLPPCWDYYNNGSSYTNYPIVYSTASYAQSGSNTLRFYRYYSDAYGDQTAIFPPMEDLSQLQLSFGARCNSSSYTATSSLAIGVKELDGTYTWLDTVAVDQLTYHTFDYPFGNYNGTGNQIALRAVKPASSYCVVHVDDVVVNYIPACSHVYNVNTPYITADSCIVTWIGNSSMYEVMYGPVATLDTTSEYPTQVYDTTIVLENLTGNTDYVVYIRQLCDDGGYSDWYGTTFRTSCTAITRDQLPYTENFDSYTAGTTTYVPCWNRLGSTADRPYVHATGRTGNYLYFYHSSGHCAAILPAISYELPMDSIMVSFYAKQYSSTYTDPIFVGTISDITDINSFVPFDTIFTTADWEEYEVSFLGYTGTSRNIAFVMKSSSSSYGCIDDVQIGLTPSCLRPRDLAVQSANTTTATITWSGDENGTYEVVYGPAGFSVDAGTPEIAYTNSHVLTNLVASTSYDVYVRANCGSDGYSYYSQITFHTPSADPVSTFPYSCNFSNGSAQGWELVNGTCTNKWVLGTAAHTGNSDSALYISNDNGTSHSYTITSSSVVFAYRDFNFTAGDYIFSYDWIANGESTLDYIRVALVPASMELTAGTTLPSGLTYNSLPAGCIALDGGSKLNLASTWQNHDEVISVPTGTYHLAILWRNDASIGNMPPAGIDNISVSQLTCEMPANLTVTHVTGDTIELLWNNNANPTLGYLVTVNNQTQVVNDTTLTLAGLTPNTLYNISVASLCSASDTSIAATTSTYTLCNYASIPYTEDFEGVSGTTVTTTNNLPNCWDYFNDGTTYLGYPIVYTGSTYAHSGNNTLRFYRWYSGTTYGEQTAILPAMQNINTLQISFWARCNSSTYVNDSRIAVGVVEGNNFVWLDTVAVNSLDYQLFDIPLNSYTGNGSQIALRAVKPDANYCVVHIDDITVDLLPTCIRPNNLNVTNVTTNSISLSWTANSDANLGYLVTYNNQSQVVYGPNATLNGLTANTLYHIGVASICSATDTSVATTLSVYTDCGYMAMPYSEDFEGVAGTTTTTINVLPNCWDYFNDGTTYTGLPQVYNSSTYSHGGTNSLKFYRWYSGTTYGDQTAILPAMQNINTLQIAFYARTSSTTYVNDSKLAVGVMEDSSYVWLDTVDVNDIAYQYFEVSLGSYTGNGEHIVLRAVKPVANYCVVYLDDLYVDNIPTCPRPTHLHTTAVTTTSATLDFTEEIAGSSWEVEYGMSGFTRGTGTTTHISAHPFTINGLRAASTYDVYVRQICGVGDTSRWSDAAAINTECDIISISQSEPYVQNFDGIAASTYNTAGVLPNCWDGYSNGTTAAYAPHVVGSSSYWYCTSGNSLVMTSGTTTYGSDKYVRLPEFSNAVNTLTLSFWMSTESQTNGVLSIGYFTSDTLESSFVAVDSIHASAQTYHGTVSSGPGVLGIYDTVSFDSVPANAKYIGFHWNYTSSFYSVCIDDVVVTSSALSCSKPNIVSVNNDYANATVVWTGASNNYEVEVKPAAQGAWNDNPTAVQGNTYTFTGLVPATAYQFRVRQDCDSIGYSDWTIGTFTTDSLPCLAPTALAANNIEGTSVDLTWTAGGAETQWMVKVWNNTYADSVIANATTTTINGLVAATAYQAAVKAICGNGAAESDWSEPISFTTATCAPVSGVQAGNITANSASISWTNNGVATQWEIEYGMAGFGQGEGTMITANANPTTITGLESELQYDVYVRAICGENWVSEWANKVTFTTTRPDGIDNVEGMNVAIYPNPTSGATTISLSGVEGEVSLVIVDMSGRRVMSDKMECSSADCVKTINVENLAQGAYFVRIQGQNTNMVKKLIVK